MEELVNAAKERVADLLEPIGGGVGEDISYDEKFDEIKAEVEKLSSLAGETCDWSTVAVISEELLQDKSKDFRIACYLATCKLREGSLEKVLDGMILIQEITEKFWDDMFPPLRRIRARAGMVDWMSSQAGPLMLDYPLRAGDNAMVKTCDDTSKALDALLRDKFGDSYPGITSIRDAMRHWVRTCPKEQKKAEPKKEEPKKEAAPAASGGAAPAPAAASGGSVSVDMDLSTPAEAKSAIKPAGQMLKRISAQLRAGQPEDPVAYRLARMGTWINLNTAPPAPNEGKTLVPPPPAHARAALENLAGSNDWLKLLNAAELHAGNYLLWLDPHRYAATAMSALGALFMKAKDELLVQVALVLKRVPNLPTLAFNDGTPFADAATQMWIENEVLPVMAGDGDGGGGTKDPIDETLDEARGLAMKGELGKALDAVGLAAAGATTPAQRFKGKLVSAQLCLGAGQPDIARSQLEGLTAEIEQHHLTSWDPKLCAQVYSGLYTSLKTINDAKKPKTPAQIQAAAKGGGPSVPPEDLAAEKAAFEMLCRLDPAEALKLSK